MAFSSVSASAYFLGNNFTNFLVIFTQIFKKNVSIFSKFVKISWKVVKIPWNFHRMIDWYRKYTIESNKIGIFYVYEDQSKGCDITCYKTQWQSKSFTTEGHGGGALIWKHFRKKTGLTAHHVSSRVELFDDMNMNEHLWMKAIKSWAYIASYRLICDVLL